MRLSFLFMITLMLAACAPMATEVIPTNTPTSTPTETLPPTQTPTQTPIPEVIGDLPGGFTDLYKGVYVGGELKEVKVIETDETHPALLVDTDIENGTKVLFINENSDTPIIFNPEVPNAEETMSKVFTYFKARLCADVTGAPLSKVLDTAVEEAGSILEEGCTAKLRADSQRFSSVPWLGPEATIYDYNIPNQYYEINVQTPVIYKIVAEPTENMFFSVGREGGDGDIRASGDSLLQMGSNTLIVSAYRTRIGTPSSGKEYAFMKNMESTLQWLLVYSGLYHTGEDSLLQRILFNGKDPASTPPAIIYYH